MNKIKSKFSSKKFILHTFGHLGDSNLHVNLIFKGGKNILKSELCMMVSKSSNKSKDFNRLTKLLTKY